MNKPKAKTQFKPTVSLSQILEFDPKRPETATASPTVNAVCAVLHNEPRLQPSGIAKRIGVNMKLLAYTLRMETGFSTSEIRSRLLIQRCRKYMAENQGWRMVDLMPILGLQNASSMTRFVYRNGHIFPELREKAEERRERHRKRYNTLRHKQLTPNFFIFMDKIYKEVKDLQLENIPVGAQREFLHEAYVEVEKSETIKTQMTRAYGPWTTGYQTMVEAYTTPLGSDETKPIHKFDNQRDQLLNGIKVVNDSSMKSPDAEVVAAAEAVEQARISFPVNPNAGYLDQTAQIDSFVEVLLGARVESTRKAGVYELVVSLKAINDQIHELVGARDEERVERLELPSRPDARQNAVNAWRFLTKYVNGYVVITLNGEVPADLANFIDTMNVKIDRYESIYLGGATPSKPSDSEETEEEEGETSEGESTEEGGGSSTDGEGSSTEEGGSSTEEGGNTNGGGSNQDWDV